MPSNGRAVFNETMPQRLVETLRQRGLRVAFAESCTGGLAMARLTSVPGASEVLWGGAVVYSEAAKREFLGSAADGALIEGPVSARVNAALAAACLAQPGVDVGAAVTGYAGPDAPPGRLGEAHVAVATRFGAVARTLHLDGDRGEVREQATTALLKLIEDALEGGHETHRAMSHKP